MSKPKGTLKRTILQATSLSCEDPRLTERERARYSEILEFVALKFFGQPMVEHLQAAARGAAGSPLHMWGQGGAALEQIVAPLEETLKERGALPSEIPLRDITITRAGTRGKQFLMGAQLERILLVMQWADFPFDDPSHGAGFWPLANAGELGALLRGLGQILEGGGEGEPDCTDTFLASAQKILSASVMCLESHDDPAGPSSYSVHVGPRTAEKGGAA